ncbi:OmpA family protein, partial [bacterium]|nr:OmpA family protein [bacterium]
FSTHDNAIRVEGFTDNQPIATPQFASNWALSSARATAVVQFLVESGIAPQRLAAIGYGEYQPVANNDTPEGRSRNRRIVLMVSPSQQLRPQASPWERSSPDASTGLAQSNTASQVPLNVERAAPTGVDERQPRQKEIAERQNAGFTFDSERSEPQNRPADATFDPGDWVKGVNTSAREQAERWLQEYGQPLPVSQQVPRPISLEQIEAESTP